MPDLASTIPILSNLSPDELVDFIYLVERPILDSLRFSSDKAVAGRAESQYRLLQLSRKGIPYDRLNKPSEDLSRALDAAGNLHANDRPALVQVAKTLYAALKPIERRETLKRKNKTTGTIEEVPTGRIEIKYVRLPVYDFDTGLRAVDEHGNKLSRGPGIVGASKEIPGFGPYLYVRVYASGGGRDRDVRRNKSKYVGLKGLAMHLEETFAEYPSGSEERRDLAIEIIERCRAGTLHAWAREHYPALEDDEEIGIDSNN